MGDNDDDDTITNNLFVINKVMIVIISTRLALCGGLKGFA